MSAEILVVPFFGQGHLFPCMELCKHIASRNLKASLIISSDLASSVPSSLRNHPLVQIHEISPSLTPPSEPDSESDPPHPRHRLHTQMALGIDKLLTVQTENPNFTRPVCAILDVMMDWLSDSFQKFHIPTVAFFTSGACSAALEYALWRSNPEDLKSGEIHLLPGLPENVALVSSDLKRRPRGPPPPLDDGGGPPPEAGAGRRRRGPPKPGDEPPWVEYGMKTKAMLMNTCDDLERPFIEYLSERTGRPVWGVGPLLPEQYWESAGSLIHDRLVRTNRRSNATEDEVIQWLDSKPRGSVLYVSFGSEVGPTLEEYPELAEALECLDRPFIWVIQPNAGKPRGDKKPGSHVGEGEGEGAGYFPHGLDARVGKRGLIIGGWAPQLLILSHPSTGGFLSHCGWNSTVEAIGRGIPFLVWPIRGDQYYDAKLVVGHFKVGYMISEDFSQMVKKDDIVKGIDMLMADKEMKKRAESLSAMFQNGFPRSSEAALDAFIHYINQ